MLHCREPSRSSLPCCLKTIIKNIRSATTSGRSYIPQPLAAKFAENEMTPGELTFLLAKFDSSFVGVDGVQKAEIFPLSVVTVFQYTPEAGAFLQPPESSFLRIRASISFNGTHPVGTDECLCSCRGSGEARNTRLVLWSFGVRSQEYQLGGRWRWPS